MQQTVVCLAINEPARISV